MAVNDEGYRHGGFWRIDARSGFKVRGYNTVKEWTGNYVDKADFEARNAQDFVRGKADKQIVPDPRPRDPVDTFIGPLVTELTTAAVAGAQTIAVTSSARMVAGDRVSVILDNGTLFTTIQSVPTAASITLTAKLPSAAAVGNQVVDLSALAQADIG